MPAARKNRVVILGGGHAGMHALRELQKRSRPEDNLEITMVNTDNAEVWHGMLPQVVSGNVQPSHILSSIRQVVPGVRLISSMIEEIDLAGRRVVLDDGTEGKKAVLEYDQLLICLGSLTDLSRFPGLAEHGLQVRTVGDVVHIRNHILEMLEHAAVEPDPEQRAAMLTFVVAGTGFAGVELSCQINTLVRQAIRYYRSIRPEEVRVINVTNADRILPQLSDKLAARGLKYMRKKGIDVRFGAELQAATSTAAIFADGSSIPTRSVIVTIGVGPNPLVTQLPVEKVNGRIKCDEFCRVVGYEGVFAAGDCAAVPDPNTKLPYCPATALASFAQGISAGKNMLRASRGHAPLPFKFNNFGEATLLGPGMGLVELFGVPFWGVVGSIIGCICYVYYMPTWAGRLSLVVDWMMSKLVPRDINQLPVSRTDNIVPMRFGAGEAIVREGEYSGRFFVVTEGQVEVVRKTAGGGEERLNTLGPGQHFGEVALMRGSRRNATVRALVQTRVLSIAGQEFSTLIRHMAALRQSMEESAVNRELPPGSTPPVRAQA